MQNCSRSIENYCFKHKKLVGFRGQSLSGVQGAAEPPVGGQGWAKPPESNEFSTPKIRI